MQRFVPTSATHCVMRFEVYRNKASSDEDFDVINSMYKRIMSEDKYLCENTQQNLNTGVFINGELHPEQEMGPLYFQNVVRELVQEHHRREEEAQSEIWPARQALPVDASTSQEDMEFCSKLTSQTKTEDGSCASVARQGQANKGCCGGMACQTAIL